MLTHHKLTMRVLRMLTHLSSNHVTLLRGEFPPPNFFPIGLTAPGSLTLGSAHISSYSYHRVSLTSFEPVDAFNSHWHRALFGYLVSLYPGDMMLPVVVVNSTGLLSPHAMTSGSVRKTINTYFFARSIYQ